MALDDTYKSSRQKGMLLLHLAVRDAGTVEHILCKDQVKLNFSALSDYFLSISLNMCFGCSKEPSH